MINKITQNIQNKQFVKILGINVIMFFVFLDYLFFINIILQMIIMHIKVNMR
ncbi:hypothetical protein C823_007158 [Eubacterium plexicaudatum ASF492]|nr:hypothetical protein C823_007158 [Eubacterium plexicaudatum ASF492]